MTVNTEAYDKLLRDFPSGHVATESSSITGLCLYGLIRFLRPTKVVEIGSHMGIAAAWMARAVAENGHGTYTGYEINPDLVSRSKALLSGCLPSGPWTIVHGSFFDAPGPVVTDFAFLDIDPKETYRQAWEHLEVPVGGVLVADDVTYLPQAATIIEYARSLPGWKSVVLAGERGLLLARREA